MQQAAFQCDNCDQLTPRKKGEKGAPQNWIRLAVQLPGADEKLTGAFHDAECASTWLDEKLTGEGSVVAPEQSDNQHAAKL
jgi:hypothetical protein